MCANPPTCSQALHFRLSRYIGQLHFLFDPPAQILVRLTLLAQTRGWGAPAAVTRCTTLYTSWCTPRAWPFGGGQLSGVTAARSVLLMQHKLNS